MGERAHHENPKRRLSMIRLEHVKKTFDGKILYDDLNLTIEDGQFVVFSGPSGCGKTTLLNIIGGLEPVDEGKVTVEGFDLRKKSQCMEFYRSCAGFLFQNFALVDNKTVRENLNMIYKKSRSECTVSEALEIVGLSEKVDTKVYKLSGGEQQRVAVARLLIKKCTVVFADEPTGSLDEANANIVIGLLQKLHDMGKTVVMVTHNEKFKNVAERVFNIEEIRT
jgi:putative ABC transport system ATP-binding protein